MSLFRARVRMHKELEVMKNSAYRNALLLGSVSALLSVEIFGLQMFTKDQGSWAFAIVFTSMFMSCVGALMCLLRGMTVSERNKSRKKRLISISIMENQVVARHNDSEFAVHARFSDRGELVAWPIVLHSALSNAMLSALNSDNPSAIMSATIELSKNEISRLTDGQVFLIKKVIKSFRPVQIIESL